MGKPIKSKPRPLRYEVLKGLISYTTLKQRKIAWQFLAQSAVRDIEGHKIKKSDCIFVDKNANELKNESGMCRIKVMIRAEEGNKLREERETFVHIEIQDYVLQRLRSISDNDYVFHDYKTPKQAQDNDLPAFDKARIAMVKEGFKECAEWTPEHTKHVISLHTLRSFFVSKANRLNDSSFGDVIAGHGEAMKALYDRISPEELLEMWIKSEPLTSLEVDNSTNTDELEKVIDTLKSEMLNMKTENQKTTKSLYDKIFDLMSQIDKKSE
jgi:hypothetical protein